MKIKKLILIIAAAVICLNLLTLNVYAAETEEKDHSVSFDDVYDEQFSLSGAEELFDSLPENTKKSLAKIGINSVNYDNLTRLDFRIVLSEVASVVSKTARTPVSAAASCIGIMLLCSMTEGFNSTLSKRNLSVTMTALGTLCICTAVSVPLCTLIGRITELLNGVSGFMLLYVPILSGLMITSGKEVTGASFYTMMMTSAQGVSYVVSKIISPVMNVFLALTIASSISPRMNLSSFCDSIYKTAKWLITLVLSIFVTVISLQTVITSSMDNVSKRTLRFAMSSFVPVVGGVIGGGFDFATTKIIADNAYKMFIKNSI